MFKIKLQNIKGIRELEFPFPEKRGVYVLTGVNGCGKTSLLITLCRLGDRMAFKNFHANTNNGIPIDNYKDSAVTYYAGTDEVTYQRKDKRWVSVPKSKSNLISKFPYKNTLFISTTGMRFFSQEFQFDKKPKFNDVNVNIISPMNQILDTDKFNNLKFVTVKNKRGRQRHLHRNNKLYVIKEASEFYSEANFSLGERLLLNTLDLLEHISSHTLLLIDEVELALHPIAQVKFYDYLRKQAKEKDLVVIISTHSSSLIKHAENRLFLERNRNGIISVVENCYPSYILREVAAPEDKKPDFIFLVEDIMAFKYLSLVIRRFLKDIKQDLVDCKIIPVGGYEEVIKLLDSLSTLGYEKHKMQAFLDQDVEQTYAELESKGNARTDANDRTFELFNLNQHNISYLSITPELGVWEWLEQYPDIFKKHLDEEYGTQNFDVVDLVKKTNKEEAGNKGGNTRSWAKGCFKNFKERIHKQNAQISEDMVIDEMIKCYVENTYDLNQLKTIFMPILNRKNMF